MVVFTCQKCNSSLKKKQIENHLTFNCRNSIVTCIDCLKDFDWKSYGGHTTCVTENERYGGKGFVATAAMRKQKQWFGCVESVARTDLAPPVLKQIVSYAANYPNCPRNKKKFTNFILNNKVFKNADALAEKAFRLIQNEFDKVDLDGGKGDEKEAEGGSGGSKRKTISETELRAEEDPRPQHRRLPTDDCDKKKKKKDKNNSTEGRESVADVGDGDDACRRSAEGGNDSDPEDHEDKENTVQENGGQLADPVDEGAAAAPPVDLSKLSKKERKKLLKESKYRAEIVSIENYKKEEEDDESTQPQQLHDKKKKKKKKEKENVAEEVEHAPSSRHQKSSISEPDDKKMRLQAEEEEEEEAEPERPKKFKWDEVIVEVLEGQSDGEMSLKRLSKKVCGEYANLHGFTDRSTYDDLLLKFNKKVTRTPGVRVLKDRAKLLRSLS